MSKSGTNQSPGMGAHPQPAEVTRTIQRMSELIEQTCETFNLLAVRIDPILRPSEPPSTALAPSECLAAPLAQSLNTQVEHMEVFLAAIVDVRNRIEL
jgi:hypothetical protein